MGTYNPLIGVITLVKMNTLPETNSEFAPEMDGWNTILSYWVPWAYFQGRITLVSGRVFNIDWGYGLLINQMFADYQDGISMVIFFMDVV